MIGHATISRKNTSATAVARSSRSTQARQLSFSFFPPDNSLITYNSSPKNFTILHGDCMKRLNEIEDNSIDAIFADPPYFLSNGGISVHSGKQVCVDKGDWDKGGTPEYIYNFNRQWLSLLCCKPNNWFIF